MLTWKAAWAALIDIVKHWQSLVRKRPQLGVVHAQHYKESGPGTSLRKVIHFVCNTISPETECCDVPGERGLCVVLILANPPPTSFLMLMSAILASSLVDLKPPSLPRQPSPPSSCFRFALSAGSSLVLQLARALQIQLILLRASALESRTINRTVPGLKTL